MDVQLRPHQKKAVGELQNGKILAGDVGVGKSITALAYFYIKECGGTIEQGEDRTTVPMSTPKDLYIITTAMKRDKLDWNMELARFGLQVGKDNPNDISIVVDSWQNIKKYREVKHAFFIFDEQRLVGNGVWSIVFLTISKSNSWILLSATPGDVWIDYAPVFIANGFYRNRTDFVRSHVVYNTHGGFRKIERYVGIKRLEKLRSSILVTMPYVKHTTRARVYINADYDRDNFKRLYKDRWNIFKNEPVKNASELFSALRRVLNADPRRLDVVEELSKDHPKMIIFYNYDNELDQLLTLADRLGIELKQWNGHKHEELPSGSRWLYLVQYTAGAEAWNCITTDTTIFYSLNYSYRITMQAEGRTDRINSPYSLLHYFYIITDSWLDKSILKSLRNKKNFNEKALSKKFIFDRNTPVSKHEDKKI